MNQARHKIHISDCVHKLNLFLENLPSKSDDHVDIALLTEHLRIALRHLGKLTGAVTTEDLLNLVFRDFCIGK